jgi:CRISPR/Cas system-associated exonuclease Cas4 (RecB family)
VLPSGDLVTFSEAREQAAQHGSFHGIPLPVLLALERQHHRVDGAWLSPSQLLECPRKRILMAQRHYYVRLDYTWAALVGTAVHALISSAARTALHEQTLQAELLVSCNGEQVPIVVKGTVDYYEPEHQRLIDFKTTSRDVAEPSLEHTLQVNAYRWLLERHGYPVKEAFLWYVRPGLMNTKQKMAQRLYPVELFTPEELQQILEELALPYAQYHQTGELPVCRCRWSSIVPNLCREGEA